MRIEVKATALGYFNDRRVRPGSKVVIDERGLKFAKVRDAKGKETEVVVLPRWCKPTKPLPSQSEMRKALNEFLNKRKASKVNAPVLAAEEPEVDEVDESQESEADGDDGSPADQEVI